MSGIFDEIPNAPAVEWESKWVVQRCQPFDQYESCTLTIEQWFANLESGQHYYGRTSEGLRAAKWRSFMEIVRLVQEAMDSGSDVLRYEPRVGYDPRADQPIFIFKADNNGTTYVVSPGGIDLHDDQELDY